jgi:hypothetical protein
MHKMAFQNVPRGKLLTWSIVSKMLVYGAGVPAVFLLLLAWLMT